MKKVLKKFQKKKYIKRFWKKRSARLNFSFPMEIPEVEVFLQKCSFIRAELKNFLKKNFKYEKKLKKWKKKILKKKIILKKKS